MWVGEVAYYGYLREKFAGELALLVNRYSDGNEYGIIIDVLSDSKDSQILFTAICKAWYEELAKIEYFDLGNEASVLLGKQIDSNTIAREIELGNVKNKQYNKVLGHYINVDPIKLANEMANIYRTLQQSFTRLCNDFI